VKAKRAEACLVIVILLSAVWLLLAQSALANPGQIIPYEAALIITINSDGSITPETDIISRNGSTYTLIDNISNCEIDILCNNIIFDGAGYSINSAPYNVYDENGQVKYVANADNPGMRIGIPPEKTIGVTIKNINIFSSTDAVRLCEGSYCRIVGVTGNEIDVDGDGNVVTNCIGRISVMSGTGNIISKNNITLLSIGYGGGNHFYLNNIFDISPRFHSSSFLDNGSVGNYWWNYSTRYPNAFEIGQTGIGDTPYVIVGINPIDGKPLSDRNIDNYPLFYPYDLENDCITLPAQPTPSALPAGEETSEPFLAVYVPVVAVSTAIVIIMAAGLIYYQRKRKTSHV
jgi:hypothetical protein